MRLTVGMKAPSFVAETIDGRRAELAALRGRTVLVKFYRFATCPVCNWQVQRMHRHALPFDVVADPSRRIFTAYGIERSWAGKFSLSVWATYARAMAAGFAPGMFTSDGGMNGQPADFIIDGDGRIAHAHYGRN